MNELTFSTDLINAILQYLGSRPYVEVSGLIKGIQDQAVAQGATQAQPPVETAPEEQTAEVAPTENVVDPSTPTE